ncbi:MAG: hypothetical protein HYR96_09995 [Deltaproteobacteria bacterium]|nr:hypothetical protein [Deltaproteobacteria bacterium]MBI3296061.1 hypothetical protein [Deltaproteobacteria bacterium]
MSKQAYLMWVLTIGLLLSISSVFARVDAVAMEIQNSETRPRQRRTFPDIGIDSSVEASFTQGSERTAHLGPIIGLTHYDGIWASRVSSNYAVGALYTQYVTHGISLEVEGLLADNTVRYPTYAHSFQQLGISMGIRMNLLDHSRVSPYVAAGFNWIYYSGLVHAPFTPSFGDWVLGGQVSTGFDFEIASPLRIGARASYTAPGFQASAPQNSFDEASIIGTGYARVMALVTMAL